ncbi:hypothetical protein C7S14_7764 [Burkholderia cepacia]|nr:hypothetical protein C7S14_7764 [Burkholderia cepacia]
MGSTGAARIGGWLVVVTCCMGSGCGFNGSSGKALGGAILRIVTRNDEGR